MSGIQLPDKPRSDADWWWIFDPRFSLCARAVLVVGGGATLFAALVVWVTGTIVTRRISTQLGQSFETLAFQVSDKLDRNLYERSRELQFAASLPAFRTNDTPLADRRRLVEAVLESSPDFTWVGFADAAGNVVCAAQGILERTSIGTRPWFLGARTQPYFGNVHELPELARQVDTSDADGPPGFLDIAVPVSGAQGQFVGVLVAHLRSWTWMREVQLSVVPDTLRSERIGVTLYGPGKSVLLDSGASGWTEPPDAPAVPERRGQRGSMIESTSLGTHYLTGYARSRGFREFRGSGWLVTVRQPVDKAFAPVAELRRSVIPWCVIFVTVFTATSWYFAAQHSRRLRNVGTAARRIRGGDILTELPRPYGAGELATMCGDLGDMVDDFRQKLPGPPAEDPSVPPRFRV